MAWTECVKAITVIDSISAVTIRLRFQFSNAYLSYVIHDKCQKRSNRKPLVGYWPLVSVVGYLSCCRFVFTQHTRFIFIALVLCMSIVYCLILIQHNHRLIICQMAPSSTFNLNHSLILGFPPFQEQFLSPQGSMWCAFGLTTPLQHSHTWQHAGAIHYRRAVQKHCSSR